MMPVTDLKTGATRKMEKLSDIEVVEKALSAQRKEFKKRMKSLCTERRNIDNDEQLKESLFKFNKFLKENNLKFARAVKKAYEEKELTKQKEAEIEHLERDSIDLQRKKEHLLVKVQRSTIYKDFLDQVTKKSKKFGDIWELIGRFDTLLANREQLLLKESDGQELAETQRRQHRYFIEERSNQILQCNNQLSSLQTHLDQVRSLAFKWEMTWNHIQSTAAKETLLLGEIKVVTLNLFYLIGGETCGKHGVHISNITEQLKRMSRWCSWWAPSEMESWFSAMDG
ncbi:coiled-coil domain-containing protein 42 homolog isoform X2 [Brienomyrus brachyistius]|uniref:coiled-coil domain-containing protein 42 homolog isoform X2 n=1 Tax=Brienomyrus brachyistius TaxID=42636 RepID=UPI0020B34AF3|nr:coiled-coil domain-containing protein 42 homolog isoform X2 [Brienomyrus brachyistius]